MPKRLPPPADTPGVAASPTDKETRALLRRTLLRFQRCMISKEFLGVLEYNIRIQIAMYEWLRKESRRKTRSKMYRQWSRKMVADIRKLQLATLGKLGPEDAQALDALIEAFLQSMLGQPVTVPQIGAKKFIHMQKTLFVTPEKRGPKLREIYDQVFPRWLDGEPLSEIAHQLEPEKYQLVPHGTLQRYFNAMQRRAARTPQSKQ